MIDQTFAFFITILHSYFQSVGGGGGVRSGGAMALGKLPVPGRPTIWIIVVQGPIAQ